LVLERTPERLLIEAEAPTRTWLFVLRGFFPYRTVLLDGEPVEVVPAQVAFSAIAMPQGRHRIDWKETLPGGRIVWLGPAVFLAAAVFHLIRPASRRSARP